LIPTDDRYEDSMRKIGADVEYSEYIKPFLKNKYAFIIYDTKYNKERNRWCWNSYNDKLTDDYSENNGYEFKGLVNIPEYELEAEKYNL